MLEINLSKKAKELAAEHGGNWLDYMDTYRQIDTRSIKQKDAAGYDLIQLARNGEHAGWEWRRRDTMPRQKEKKQQSHRMVIRCTPEYLQMVQEEAKKTGFDSYANYIKYCINMERSMRATIKKD